jgi:parallel beta-helix repeat protein
MKKTIALGIVLLLVFMSFTSISGIQINNQIVKDSSRGNILIVDDEGDGDYTTIKEAVDNASSGDIIEVYSGIYYEYGIEIQTENITLKGIPYELGNGGDTGKPFINGRGQGKVMTIWVQGFTITGFKIENNGGTIACGIIGTRKGADNCVISNNDIAHAITGCVGIISNNNSIINNNISYSALRQGIALGEQCANNLISDNLISDVDTGILLWDSNHNTITGNKIMRCRDFGIDVAGSYNKIIGNHLENNSIGVQIYEFFNTVKRNNFLNNELNAQFIYGIPFYQRLTNKWFNNYWGQPRLLPYPIPGLLVLFPIVQFDWFPASEPYDITTAQGCDIE